MTPAPHDRPPAAAGQAARASVPIDRILLQLCGRIDALLVEVQQAAGAMGTASDRVLGLGPRTENALLSYVGYIGKMFWPGLPLESLTSSATPDLLQFTMSVPVRQLAEEPIRFVAMQIWPLLVKAAQNSCSAIAATSASGITIAGSLPPSSSVTRFSVSAPVRMMRRPTSREPVNAILSTSACLTSASPAVGPNPVVEAGAKRKKHVFDTMLDRYRRGADISFDVFAGPYGKVASDGKLELSGCNLFFKEPVATGR